MDGRALLSDKGLTGTGEEWDALVERYSGNPLALKVVAETIRELFNGGIGAFLQAEPELFGGVHDLLAQQFARLSTLEQAVMLWLAVEREPVEMETLHADLVEPIVGCGAVGGVTLTPATLAVGDQWLPAFPCRTWSWNMPRDIW